MYFCDCNTLNCHDCTSGALLDDCNMLAFTLHSMRDTVAELQMTCLGTLDYKLGFRGSPYCSKLDTLLYHNARTAQRNAFLQGLGRDMQSKHDCKHGPMRGA